MYCLQKGGPDMIKKAKSLFDRYDTTSMMIFFWNSHSFPLSATHRADYPPHLLALQKLGWLAERRVI